MVWTRIKKTPWLLLGIMVVAIFLRSYHFRDHLAFQGDQGRDAIEAKNILIQGDIALVGPVTSVGNMYLGPLYYYLMVPFLALTYPDPSGPAYGIALLSVLTVYLTYVVGKEMFGKSAGLLASFLLATMGLAVTYGRFSWNPNIGPILGLLLTWSVWKAGVKKRYGWLLLSGLSMAGLLQSHYVTLAALPVLMGVMVWVLLTDKKQRRAVLGWSGAAFLVLIMSFAPLVVFDWRHNHLISKNFETFFTSPEQHIRPIERLGGVIKDMQQRSWLVFAQLIKSSNPVTDQLLTYGMIGLTIWFIVGKRVRKQEIKLSLGLLFGFLVVAVVAISFYTSSIFDHYLLYLLPILALFYGFWLNQLWRFRKLGPGLVIVLLSAYGWVNLRTLDIWRAQPAAIDQYAQVANDTLIKLPQGSYNLALLSASHDYTGMNYRYFFEVEGRAPLPASDYVDPEYLAVIDELGISNQLNLPLYEIKAGGPRHLVTQFTSDGGVNVSIYVKDAIPQKSVLY